MRSRFISGYLRFQSYGARFMGQAVIIHAPGFLSQTYPWLPSCVKSTLMCTKIKKVVQFWFSDSSKGTQKRGEREKTLCHNSLEIVDLWLYLMQGVCGGGGGGGHGWGRGGACWLRCPLKMMGIDAHRRATLALNRIWKLLSSYCYVFEERSVLANTMEPSK